MLERGGVVAHTIYRDNYVVNLKVVSTTTKCRDFTVILPVFSKMHRDFADFLP